MKVEINFSLQKKTASAIGERCEWKCDAACVLEANMLQLELTIGDYAKDGRPVEVQLLCSFCHEPLRN